MDEMTECNGTAVTVTGYPMDNFCIDRGTLLDNPDFKTLEHPEVHSLHCLAEVPQCVDSGYALLAEPLEGEAEYTVAYQLETSTRDKIMDIALAALKDQDKMSTPVFELTGMDDGSGTLKCVNNVKVAAGTLVTPTRYLVTATLITYAVI